MVNLVISQKLVDNQKEMLSVNKRSYMICHMLTLQIFSAPKRLRFWQNREEMLNWLNSGSWVDLYEGHMQGLRGEVTYKGHVQGSHAAGVQICWSNLYLKMGNQWYASTNSSRVKHRCQLVVRLKTNKYY